MVALRRVALCSIAPLLLLAIGVVFFPSGGRDDAHIGYWVALCLSRFGKVMNYNGVAIEQSSTLLHALILAAAHRLSGINMIVLGRLSAMVFGVAAVLLVQRLAARIDRRLAMPAGLLTASSAYFAYWSFGGMEATLCALLAVWIVLLFGDYVATPNERLFSARLIWIAFVMLLFLLVRPEQPLVLFSMLAGAVTLAIWKREPVRRVFVLAFIAVFLVAAIFHWRWHTFGSLFPQPVSAKSGSLSMHTFAVGLRYYRKHILFQPGVLLFVIVAVTGAVRAWREKNPYLIFALLFLISSGAFVLLAGGDWMEAGRFFVPLFPLAALFVAFALSRWSLTSARVGAAVIVLGQLSAIYFLAARDSTAVPIWSSVTPEPYATRGARAATSPGSNAPIVRTCATSRPCNISMHSLGNCARPNRTTNRCE